MAKALRHVWISLVKLPLLSSERLYNFHSLFSKGVPYGSKWRNSFHWRSPSFVIGFGPGLWVVCVSVCVCVHVFVCVYSRHMCVFWSIISIGYYKLLIFKRWHSRRMGQWLIFIHSLPDYSFMCVCVCVCASLCVCVRIRVYVCGVWILRTHMHACMHVCVRVYVH